MAPNTSKSGGADADDPRNRRESARHRVLLVREIQTEGMAEPVRIRVRDISARGMMAEASVRMQEGERLILHLADGGQVAGAVLWVRGLSFGIIFESDLPLDQLRGRPPADPKKLDLDRAQVINYKPTAEPLRKVAIEYWLHAAAEHEDAALQAERARLWHERTFPKKRR